MTPGNTPSHPAQAEIPSTADYTIPFNFAEHGARYRRSNHDCEPDGIKYVLFVLDTSGSIGINTFNTMKERLSCLVPLFCDPIKVAVMTFNHEYYMEFCFDCYDGNTCEDRRNAGTAIRNIIYRSGLTHTGGAMRCLDQDILSYGSQLCGIEHDINNCFQIVFITDGGSNDPRLNVCDEVQHLHLDSRVTVHAMGIGNNVNNAEINCIRGSNPASSYFYFNTFDEFNEKLNTLVTLLGRPEVGVDGVEPYTCLTDTDNPSDSPLGTDAEWCGPGSCFQ